MLLPGLSDGGVVLWDLGGGCGQLWGWGLISSQEDGPMPGVLRGRGRLSPITEDLPLWP